MVAMAIEVRVLVCLLFTLAHEILKGGEERGMDGGREERGVGEMRGERRKGGRREGSKMVVTTFLKAISVTYIMFLQFSLDCTNRVLHLPPLSQVPLHLLQPATEQIILHLKLLHG